MKQFTQIIFTISSSTLGSVFVSFPVVDCFRMKMHVDLNVFLQTFEHICKLIKEVMAILISSSSSSDDLLSL